MKRMVSESKGFLWSIVFLAVAALSIVGCGGGGGGGGGTSGAATTTISGKVTLSSTVASKPAMMKAMYSAPKGKPGSKAYAASKKTSMTSTALKSALFASVLNSAAFANGYVYLYDSDHPEWLCPVASDQTDSDGNYVMTTLENSSCNGSAYTDGAGIPSGNYTLLAFKAGGFDPILGITTDALVAVQTVVNKFEGTVSVDDLVAQESDSLPTVSSMFGVKKNTDGTQTWGSNTTEMPTNAAIQVSFSAAMSRGTLTNGITISPSVSGEWSLSADWTTATFYPDAGVTLSPSQVYTVTVKGADTSTTNAVKNVYGNALAKTAIGTFKAITEDIVAPTAEWESPETIEMTLPVDVTKPIRIRANKQLDVNGLLLEGKVNGVSSLGAKPGVLYIGTRTETINNILYTWYIYEFVLGEPLKLGTTYDLTVSGGKGLNGKEMNTLPGSLQTVSLADVAGGSVDGIGGTTDTTTLNAQAAVKDVFGKWIRAFSDRNLTQLQGLMSGDFYFEEDPSHGISEDDLNRDGRLSLAEFTDMLSTHAFPGWENCGTTITGDIAGTINVVGDNADFEFKMTATSTNTSKECGEAAPKDSLYATLQNVNGAWTIVRASEGIDTRDKTISFPDLITASLSQGGAAISNGGQAQLPYDPIDPATHTNPLTYSWDAVSGVSSYVLVRIDGRDPRHGKACALPTTVTSFSTATGCVDSGGVEVSDKFGFDDNSQTGPFLVEGGGYYWDVIGLATITVSTISNKTPLDILRDISAISALNSFTIAGSYKEISVQVYAGSAATGTPVTFSELFEGYDVGSASQATIKVTTANTTATQGSLDVSGNFWKSYPLTFDSSGVATVTVDLSKGWNWINVSDTTDWSGLNKGFSINTTGGIAPVVEITQVKDDIGNILTGDSWKYYTATTGATKVTIKGNVTNTNITNVDVNVWNDASSAYSYTQAPVTCGTSCTFSATLEIYKGDNWINVGAGFQDPTNGWVWYGDNAGVYTDTGTVWVPNITITSVTTATSTGNYGNSADYDASTDADGVVTIKGKFKNIQDGNYNINSDGGWSNGTLKVLSDGTFSLDVTLYNGWNYVSINDANYNWYGVNIYTTTGKTVVKPTITAVNGTAPTVPQYGGAGSVSTTGCTATVTGTAKAGDLNVYWNGYDGTNYYWESQTLVLSGTADTAVNFSFNVPLVGGTGSYNNIDVYDLNWIWTGVKVTTSGSCTYVNPAMTVDTVKDSSGTTITLDTYSTYNVGSSTTITVSGTSNRAGRTVTVSSWACGTQLTYSTTASSTANGSDTYDWSISGIKVYDGYGSVNIGDGYNWSYISVNSTNGVQAVPALTVSVSGLTPTYQYGCGSNQYDAGTATTVTITGTTTAPDGQGNYTDSTGGNLTFDITNGSFTISGITVYDGYNNIYLYDTSWNYQNVSIYTTNGVMKPKFVDITAPSNTSTTTFVTGLQTVAGTIVTSGGYSPKVVRASMGVWDATAYEYTYTDYSSDVYDQTTYGNSAITYDAATGNFSFSADFGAGSYTYIHVYAYDDVTYTSHGMQMYYNDGYPTGSSGSSYYYKPGAKAKSASRNQAVASELMKRRLKVINKGR